jgi:hypothetical protein
VLSACKSIAAPTGEATKVIYWHDQPPPIDAELIGEHAVEAPVRLRFSDRILHANFRVVSP